MPVINTDAGEIHCKIIYYGPPGAGKSSSLEFIRSRAAGGKLTHIPFSAEGETNAVNLYLLSLRRVLNHRLFFQILNIPRNSPEEDFCLLNGADGIVFVADSRQEAEERNKKDLEELGKMLSERGKDIFQIPLALQYNKRDMENIMPFHLMRADLNKHNNRDFASSVIQGRGVMAPLRHICRLTLVTLKSGEFL